MDVEAVDDAAVVLAVEYGVGGLFAEEIDGPAAAFEDRVQVGFFQEF